MAPVPHRQYVFTVPKLLRVCFRRARRLLGRLSQCAADALNTLFRAACKDRGVVPGIIIAIQTYGDLVNFHPHLHALVTDGVFTPTGWFVAFPTIDLYVLEQFFRQRPTAHSPLLVQSLAASSGPCVSVRYAATVCVATGSEV